MTEAGAKAFLRQSVFINAYCSPEGPGKAGAGSYLSLELLFTRKCPHLDVMAVSDQSLTLHGLSWLNSHEGRDRLF